MGWSIEFDEGIIIHIPWHVDLWSNVLFRSCEVSKESDIWLHCATPCFSYDKSISFYMVFISIMRKSIVTTLSYYSFFFCYNTF